jgi:hypothetical protein
MQNLGITFERVGSVRHENTRNSVKMTKDDHSAKTTESADSASATGTRLEILPEEPNSTN